MTEREFMVVVISWFLKRCFCIIKAFQLIRLACPVMHWWVELSQATTSALARPSWFRYNNRYQHQTTGCFKIIVFLFFYVKYSKGKKTLQCVWRHFSWIDRYLSIDLCVIYRIFLSIYLSKMSSYYCNIFWPLLYYSHFPPTPSRLLEWW